MTGDDGAVVSRPCPGSAATFTFTHIPVVQQEGEGFGYAVQRLVHVRDLSVDEREQHAKLRFRNFKSAPSAQFSIFSFFLVFTHSN